MFIKKVIKILAITFASIVGILFVLYFFVRLILNSQFFMGYAKFALRDLAPVNVEYEKISLSLSDLIFSDLEIKEINGGGSILKIKKAKIKFSLFPPVIERLKIESAVLQLPKIDKLFTAPLVERLKRLNFPDEIIISRSTALFGSSFEIRDIKLDGKRLNGEIEISGDSILIFDRKRLDVMGKYRLNIKEESLEIKEIRLSDKEGEILIKGWTKDFFKPKYELMIEGDNILSFLPFEIPVFRKYKLFKRIKLKIRRGA